MANRLIEEGLALADVKALEAWALTRGSRRITLAAFDSSPPAIMVVVQPDKMIVAPHSPVVVPVQSLPQHA